MIRKHRVGSRFYFNILMAIVFPLAFANGCGGGGSEGTRVTIEHSAEAELKAVETAMQSSTAQWTPSINPISQLSLEDQARLVGDEMDIPSTSRLAPKMDPRSASALPATIDWRDKGGASWLSAVKNQGTCNSCVAFASVGVVESLTRIAANNATLDIDLSEAHLYSCGGEKVCAEGWSATKAAAILQETGVTDETCLPYSIQNKELVNTCEMKCADWAQRLTTIESWSYAYAPDDPDSTKAWIKTKLQYGPVVGSMKVYQDFFYYESGVYEHVYGDYRGGHAIVIVGYNDTDGYWIVRNSYGTDWGESGYIRIKYGQCDIENRVSVAMTLSQSPPAVTATVSTTDAAITNGQAQITLTCDTFGDYDTLEGRCYSNDDWTAISSGNSMTCTYTIFGFYTPACRVNQSQTDVLDTPVTAFTPTCSTDADCDDGNDRSLDTCLNPGLQDSTCSYSAIACIIDADCQDMSSLTIDTCSDGGTANASCSHVQIACNTDANCSDGDDHTLDACANGGTVNASCSHTAIACLNNAECDDSNSLTNDYCRNDGETTSYCFNVHKSRTIAAGRQHACAVTSTGTVQCWGKNTTGQLGNNSTTDSAVPVDVTGITGAVAVVASFNHSCVMLETGGIKCWGADTNYSLGYGGGGQSLVPVDATGVTDAIDMASGGGMHVCAVIHGGALACWGSDVYGQQGDGGNTDVSVPTLVNGLSDVVMVAAGENHTCALISGGTMKCWGYNQSGQLGDNDAPNNKSTPTDVSGISQAAYISAGWSHTCAVLTTGAVNCWGDNSLGQLGDGNMMTTSAVPVAVSNVSQAVAVEGGNRHTCALLSTGAMQCWGRGNEGELGNGAGSTSTTPVDVTGITTGAGIASGYDFSLGLLTSADLKSWGYNNSGQLGDNDAAVDKNSPVAVTGF